MCEHCFEKIDKHGAFEGHAFHRVCCYCGTKQNMGEAPYHESQLERIHQLEAEVRKAKGFIRDLILAHKATNANGHYEATGDARRFIGME